MWTATSGLAIAFGPLLSGWLLESHAWGSTFLVNLPLVLVAIVAALALVPPSKAPAEGRLDLGGGGLSIVWIGALVYGIIEGPTFGWGVGAIAALTIAALGLAAFVARELRHPRPLVDMRQFRARPFTGAMIAVSLLFFGIFGAVYYSSQHLQFVLGYSAIATGVRLLPLAGAVFVGAAVTSLAGRRFGPRPTILAGMTIAASGVLLLTGGSGAAPQAIDSSFAHAVSHPSLIAGIVMLAGAVLVLAVLPGSRATAHAPLAARSHRRPGSACAGD
ncbi:MAG: MFS transporter [Solirubrobacteraceae bacterium]